MTLTFEGIAADGSMFSGHSTFKQNGKDYPIIGARNCDTLSLKLASGGVRITLKMAGTVVGTATRTIFAHGKSLTLTLESRGTDASGVSYHDFAVYEKR
jgi:hypothetical protein